MGQAKRKAIKNSLGHVEYAQTLPRQFYAIMFKAPHRLAGQVLRRGRGAAIAFTLNEARAMLSSMVEEKRIAFENIDRVHIVATVLDRLPNARVIDFNLDDFKDAPEEEPKTEEVAAPTDGEANAD